MSTSLLTVKQSHAAPRRSQDANPLPMIKHDLTDEQWYSVSRVFLIKYRSGIGRPRETSLRAVLDGILHRQAYGLSWRNVPKRYGGFRTLHDRFCQWSDDGTLHRVAARLRIAELQPQHEEYLRLIREDERLHRAALRNRD